MITQLAITTQEILVPAILRGTPIPGSESLTINHMQYGIPEYIMAVGTKGFLTRMATGNYVFRSAEANSIVILSPEDASTAVS